jgi:proline dehydrogenase
MLGEAALTADDAKRYRVAYEDAIHAIGKASAGRGVYEGPGISIKLSALHPRYSRAQHARVMAELYPVLRALTLLAQQYDIGLNIDAEEADRLELSLDLLERLCFEPALAGWNGIGFVIQAYQKRCPFVIDYVVDLARRSRHRLMVRLVKGAYWDSEIKRAQVDGLDGYPVYTRKAYTDVSYLACARRLLAAPERCTRSSPRTTRTRWPPSTRWPTRRATRRGSTSSSACTAWASRCTSRWWAAGAARPAASTRRWARTRRCWPTWCAACWRTAPTPRS